MLWPNWRNYLRESRDKDMDTKLLRQKILDLAIHGKLVPQDPNDEPASVLLERIMAEKERLIKEGKIKAPKKSKSSDTSHYEKIEGPFEIPESWEWTTMNFCNLYKSATSNPFLYPEQDFELYSVPTFDTGMPEFVKGQDVSSSKKVVERGDVLLCKINPHLNRVWLVSQHTEFDCIASSEWIIFRNKEFDASYLIYCFQSPYFKDLMLSNVSGVGGSLTRAQPESVGKYLFPVPPVQEQKKISTALDALFSLINEIDYGKNCLKNKIYSAKSMILSLAISGKLVPQDPSDEPAIELLKRINPDFKPCDNSHYPFEIPDNWSLSTFGQLNNHQSKTINPLSEPEKTFELYSVPIFETGKPEILKGIEIGSTKQLVHKGEVLVCKINPHLNRVWVVEHYNTQMDCIASSEWIVFQHPALLPKYALLYFQSPYFRERLMSNVSGVGGSLMRARPSAVDGYILPIPPINEQRRIVQAVDKLLDNLSSIGNFL